MSETDKIAGRLLESDPQLELDPLEPGEVADTHAPDDEGVETCVDDVAVDEAQQ